MTRVPAHWFRLPRPLPVAHGVASLGFPVIWIPIDSKHPTTKRWQFKATTDARQIEYWSSRWSGTNWCVLTGREHGLFVIDVDGPHGRATLADLESKLGPLPADTWRVISGSKKGGEHIWLAPPAGTDDLRNQQPIKADGVTYKGVDIRGWHGQAILAGSLHSSGNRYTWAPGCAPSETTLKECPASWWSFLPKKELAKSPATLSRSPSRTTRTPSVQHDPLSDVIGDDGGGFNSPIWKRCWNFFRMFGPDADATEFKEALRFAILNANRDDHTAEQIERYASPEYLDAEIASARSKFTNAA